MAVDHLDLWERYKSHGDLAARDELVAIYLPLVERQAKKFHRQVPNLDLLDDLTSDGTMGLLDAIEKFIPELGNRFETYSTPRIRGAIYDGLRRMDWIPRGLRSEISDLNEARERTSTELQRAATDEEVLDFLGWPEDLYWSVVARAQETRGGIDSVYGAPPQEDSDEAVSLADTLVSTFHVPGSADRMEDLRKSLVLAIAELTERQRMVLALRYFRGLKFSEIGVMMKVAESRVSQIHTKAILAVRESMTRMGEE